MKIKLQTGNELSVAIPEPSDRCSFFLLSLTKAGSTLLNKIFSRINPELEIPEIHIEAEAFAQGIPPAEFMNDPQMAQLLHSKGYCYRVFRQLYPFMREFFENSPKSILLVRDPRDILTSLYFSTAYSHSIPRGQPGEGIREARRSAQESDIDSFVIELAPITVQSFESYLPLLARPHVAVFKYEDVIFEKAKWIRQMLHFVGESLPDERISEIASEFNHHPIQEDPTAHIRKVTPGDHREKLKEETIGQLNEQFSRIMAAFEYKF